MPDEGGKIGHAELEIGSGLVMLADEFPERDVIGPSQTNGSPVIVSIYMEDVDSVCKKAIDAGAKELRPVEDQFYGDRTGSFEDPFGHRWSVATHVEDVTPEEMARRAEAADA